MPASVQVRQLTKHYGPVTAVRDVSFEIAPGEVFGLLGPNGAGKTTTLECLLGLRRPDAGTIRIDGVDTAVARGRVGAQIQGAALQDKITPREALALHAAFFGTPVAVAGLLARFALAEKADAAFDTLSTGQRQRLAVALAFVNDPALVVLDEPTAGLDPLARRELHAVIARQRGEGRTVLLSTHYLEEAHQLCDRIGILDRGRLVAAGAPAALIAAARARPRIEVRTARAFATDGLPGVAACERRGEATWLATAAVNETVAAVVQRLQAEGNELRGLEIHRPTLEDVFIEITGRKWEEAGA